MPSRSANIAWEIVFDAEVRRLPAQEQAELLRRMRRWRNTRSRAGLGRRRARPFRVVRRSGGWDPLF